MIASAIPPSLGITLHDTFVFGFETREYRALKPEALLKVANLVREAGGAGALDALLPSEPRDISACLIANALNFECEVKGAGAGRALPGAQWAMTVTDEAVGREIAKALGEPLLTYPGQSWRPPEVLLPELVGNSAAAFDQAVPEYDEFVVEDEIVELDED